MRRDGEVAKFSWHIQWSRINVVGDDDFSLKRRRPDAGSGLHMKTRADRVLLK